MQPLCDLQQAFARSLITGGSVPAAISGRLQPEEAMRIHRNTVMGALAGALRLSYPTVDALVGEASLDQAAYAFAEAEPPCTPSLSLYGEGFAAFLADYAPSATLPYLADVARLDFAIDRALQGDAGKRIFALDGEVAITLPRSLAVLPLTYPADEIRAAIGNDAALAAIALDPAEHILLVWRQGDQAWMRRIAPLSGRFLRALLAGAAAQDALAAAGEDQVATLAQIQADIFTAPFCSIISNPEGFQP